MPAGFATQAAIAFMRPSQRTREQLEQSPPSDLERIAAESFSVTVIRMDARGEHGRYVRAYERVLKTSRVDAAFQTTRVPPFVVKRMLTFADALFVQFELICCEIISVIVADAVMASADRRYLDHLFSALLKSEEFAPTSLRIISIPDNDAGDRFTQQFIGTPRPIMPHSMMTTHKKAKAMIQWAGSIGAIIQRV